jgi:MYXO-CTERM domain-containing protein
MWKKLVCLNAILLAAFAGGCDLPPGDFTDPAYWGQVFLDKYAAERRDAVENMEAGPPRLEEPRTVLLITGVTIPAEWFDPIKLRLERDGFRPVVYEPPDLLSGDLFHNAELLGEVVERVRNESGQDKIDILAECTGGVIARHYIQSLGGDRYVSRLVTFISPQHGVDKAPWAASIAGWPALDDLTPGSEFLETVNSRTPPPSVAVTSIYSCTDEYIQPYETSIIPGATNIGLCDGFVGHYSFFYEPWIYLIMHQALTAPAPSDPATLDEETEGQMGCSVGSRSTGGSALVLLAVAAALALHRRRAR